MNNLNYKLALFSLAFVWIATAIVSAIISPEIGFSILAKVNIVGTLADIFVFGGSLLDLILGIWILSQKAIKLCCWVQAITVLSYTLLLTLIDASFWVHPFGPLTKNIPILVLVMLLYKQADKKAN